MSSKSIDVIILSCIVSNFAHFFETQCRVLRPSRHIIGHLRHKS